MMHFNDRILAVDDNATNLAVLEELLANEHPFRAATSGEDALRVAAHFEPDLILLDVMMHECDGFETCRLLRQQPQLKHTRIVMVSARSDVDARLEGYQAGADDFIAKPFDNKEILAKVMVWLRQRSEVEVHRLADELEAARDALSHTLISLVGFQRVESGEHLFRIRWYAQTIAEQLSLHSPYSGQIDDNFLRNLNRSSPLHDIGMLTVPNEILLKSGSLNAEEREQVRRHCERGAKILTQMISEDGDGGFLQMALHVVKYHHERFDGTGYPAGLAGKAIPLEARIVSAADVFDALTTERAYHLPLEVSEAMSVMRAESGKQLDPNIVNILSICENDFREAHAHFMDRLSTVTPSFGDPSNIPAIDTTTI